MGHLADGKWRDEGLDTKSTGGRFERQASTFRNWITPDGKPGPEGDGGFEAEAGRYHLYVAMACPWAHRTLIFRRLKSLEDAISVSVVDPLMLDEGWTFSKSHPDHVNGARRLYEIYLRADPGFTGRVTVPTLWDRKRETIVNNESADIIRMMNSAFAGVDGVSPIDFYPETLREEIDAVNKEVYANVNNGVYKAGFATAQDAYEEAVTALFETLDALDDRLAGRRYLAGTAITEADWRLFTTLVRFDPVYAGHFKCNIRRIADYPHLSNYLRELYQVPGVAETVDMDEIKRHYYGSHRQVNPTGIVPVGPALDYDAPHNREKLRAA